MSTIQAAFKKAVLENRAAFIPYITAGDPDLAATKLYVEALAAAGADVIELGVPFSDPVADGPTNQAAATRALASGTTLEKILALVGELRASGFKTPLVLFTYLNPIFKMGYGRFAKTASEAGVSGVLTVDLPPEEAAVFNETLKSRNLDTVFLSSPTTAEDRLPLIDRASTGFVYYASRAGVTGVQTSLTDTLTQELARVKRHVKNPIAVGFGISTPAHVKALAPHADAVVVGSALVKIIETAKSPQAGAQAIAKLTKDLVKELSKC